MSSDSDSLKVGRGGESICLSSFQRVVMKWNWAPPFAGSKACGVVEEQKGWSKWKAFLFPKKIYLLLVERSNWGERGRPRCCFEQLVKVRSHVIHCGVTVSTSELFLFSLGFPSQFLKQNFSPLYKLKNLKGWFTSQEDATGFCSDSWRRHFKLR